MLPSILNRFGKYRVLVVSIALFLIFDLGVLALNFYTSGKIAEQTERINLAARQTTLSQQMSKSTLYIKSQKLQQWVYVSALDELKGYYATFSKTIDIFDKGGEIQSAQTGLPVYVKSVENPEARVILDKAIALWSEYETVLSPLMVDGLITDDEIVPASEFIARNNLIMFNHMSELTRHFTQESDLQTSFLRMVQVIGITLATVNFFIILFHFIKQLKTRDDRLDLKQHESDQILSTIAEGVFLVNKNMVIGGQHSTFMTTLFHTKQISGRRLSRFLSAYFSKKTVETAMDYVQLYFKKHINTELIADVNPLKRVKALIPNEENQVEERYLDFSFALIKQNDGEKLVLVTVNDVTDTIMLEREAEKSESTNEQQMVMFSQLSKIGASDLDVFVDELETGYEALNELLKNNKNITDNYNKTLSRLFRETHKLKGGASTVNLDWIVDQLHDFESEIDDLQKRRETQKLAGRDLLPLTIKLKSMYESLDGIKDFSDRLNAYGIERGVAFVPQAANEPMENKRWFELKKLAADLSSEQDKLVDVHLRGFNDVISPELSDILYPMVVQLIRNSIAHGFESHETRARLKKPNAGQVSLSLSHDSEGSYRFVYEDDGRGFDYQSIRNTLVEKGLVSEEKAMKLNKTDLVRRSFSERFSTRKNTDRLAGRGVGLPVVWTQVQELKGTLKIRSVEKEFTQFIIDFGADFQNKHVELSA